MTLDDFQNTNILSKMLVNNQRYFLSNKINDYSSNIDNNILINLMNSDLNKCKDYKYSFSNCNRIISTDINNYNNIVNQINNSNGLSSISINKINNINSINNIININDKNPINNNINFDSNDLNLSKLTQRLNYYNSLNQINNNDCKINCLNISNFINNNNSKNKKLINNNYLSNDNELINPLDKSLIEDFKKFINNLSIPLVNFLCTPKGTIEIQQKLGKSNNECKIFLIKLLNKEGLSTIMKNIYGNYFFQQLIKGKEGIIISLIISFILDEFVNISKDSSGTFSVQALLNEVSSINEEQQILNCIKAHEMEMAFNKNATYVLQKIILLFPDVRRINLNEVILNNFKDLCLDSNGICLIKNFIKTNTLVNNKKRINEEIEKNFIVLAESPFGNYGIQFLMENWDKNELNNIKNKILENIYKLSIQKFSSNVVEKAIEIFDEEKMIKKLCFEGKFITLLKNKFGRFVLYKAISSMKINLKNEFEIYLKNNINNNVYSQKDKNKVKKFVMKIKNNKIQNDFNFDLNKRYFVSYNMGNFCNFDFKDNKSNNNFGSTIFF